MKTTSGRDLRQALVRRQDLDHKGIFGHVLIIAGSRGMAGAAILSTRAALRSGAGLVTLALPQSLQSTVAGHIPEAMTLGLPENSQGCLTLAAVKTLKINSSQRAYTVLAIGPGLSQHPDTGRFFLQALKSLPLPAVIDADGLNFLAGHNHTAAGRLLAARQAPVILTPHPGEMARCLGTTTNEVSRHRQACVEKLARQWGCVALLKGHQTLISNGRGTVINPTGSPGLAKGGSGDVLTGLIAGLWAQRLASDRGGGDPAMGSAILGAWLHGKAGQLAQKQLTPWAMTASNIIASLPQAFALL